MKISYKQCRLAGVLSILLVIGQRLLLKNDGVIVQDESINLMLLYFFQLITVVSFAFFIYGYVLIAEKYKNFILKYSAYVVIIVYILNTILSTLFDVTAKGYVFSNYILSIPNMISGLTFAAFGISIIRLFKITGKTYYGHLSVKVGFITLVYGLINVTWIYRYLNILMIFVTYIALAFMLHHFRDIVDQKINMKLK